MRIRNSLVLCESSSPVIKLHGLLTHILSLHTRAHTAGRQLYERRCATQVTAAGTRRHREAVAVTAADTHSSPAGDRQFRPGNKPT